MSENVSMTFEEKLRSLFAPTPQEYILQREGGRNRQTGQPFYVDYTPWSVKLKQFADVFPDFHQEVKQTLFIAEKNQWNVLVRITVFDHDTGKVVIRENWGCAPFKEGIDNGIKDATSDAFSRTAMMFGVNLDLWMKQESREATGLASEESDKPSASPKTRPPRDVPPKPTPKTPSEKPKGSWDEKYLAKLSHDPKKRWKQMFACFFKAESLLGNYGIGKEEWWDWVRETFKAGHLNDLSYENCGQVCLMLMRAEEDPKYLEQLAEKIGPSPDDEPEYSEDDPEENEDNIPF